VQCSPTLTDRVRLVGAVTHDRMPAFYSAADLFVVGSHHEGSGYALMEACACGAVPVVTDIPTFRLLTGGPIAGALWTAGDGRAFARALVNVSRRDLVAERARLADYFKRELSWSAVGRRALEIYDDVLSRRRVERSDEHQSLEAAQCRLSPSVAVNLSYSAERFLRCHRRSSSTTIPISSG
jgi:glycosyltransferase involved in cell wall biosynthesis